MKIEDFLQENAHLVDEYLERNFAPLSATSSLVFPILYGAKGGKKIRASLTPVSYTHLDVYKRQVTHPLHLRRRRPSTSCRASLPSLTSAYVGTRNRV